MAHIDLYTKYSKLQDQFYKGELSFNDYSAEIIDWGKDFRNMIKKAKTNQLAGDLSHGGKLIQKKVLDKNGNVVNKWVKSGQDVKSDDKKSEEEQSKELLNSLRQEENRTSIAKWTSSLDSASNYALENAEKFASSEEVRRLARNERIRRSFNLEKYSNFSKMPTFFLDDYFKYYNVNLTNKAKETISFVNDHSKFKEINSILQNKNKDLSKEDKLICNKIDSSINDSSLINDITMYTTLFNRESSLIINHIVSLEPGDIFETSSYLTPSIQEGTFDDVKKLYSSTANLKLKIYGSVGQKALPLNIDDDFSKNNYKFILPRNQKFIIVKNVGDTIELKIS